MLCCMMTILVSALSRATPAYAADVQEMHRLYNRWTGEHFYTASLFERDSLTQIGWKYEGVGWVAPSAGDPVYRLYNPYAVTGAHHYTTDVNERQALIEAGLYY